MQQMCLCVRVYLHVGVNTNGSGTVNVQHIANAWKDGHLLWSARKKLYVHAYVYFICEWGWNGSVLKGIGQISDAAVFFIAAVAKNEITRGQQIREAMNLLLSQETSTL